MAKRIALFKHKGGVNKTTSAPGIPPGHASDQVANLGVESWAPTGLVVDFHRQ
jgi:hypothetical protein